MLWKAPTPTPIERHGLGDIICQDIIGLTAPAWRWNSTFAATTARLSGAACALVAMLVLSIPSYAQDTQKSPDGAAKPKASAPAVAKPAPKGVTIPGRAIAIGPQSVADLAEKLQKAVVNISTRQKLKKPKRQQLPSVPEGTPFEEFFREFFNKRRQQGPRRRPTSLGSGFVIDPSGLIVTNNHVIQGGSEIQVSFHDGTTLKVTKVLGRDPKTDLALLKVEPKKPLTAVTFGNSSVLRVGDWVMAIGNPFGLGGTVTVGIISARNRDIRQGPYDQFLQTDAAINKGNSGGPLFNMKGEVIGVNTAIFSPSGGSIGLGFAVPSDSATLIIDQLKKFGKTRRGWLGVFIQSVTDEIAESLGLGKSRGALVARVTTDSPAAKGGIKTGDIILKFDGKDVESNRTLPRIVARTSIEKDVDVIVIRDGKRQTLKVRIGRLDEETAAKKAGKPAVKTVKTKVLGLAIAPMSAALRLKYKLAKDAKGVVVTEVDPASDAARNGVKVGDVIVEVTQVSVAKPGDVVKRIEEIKKSGRKSVLLLISDAKGDMRFIAVPVGG